MFFFILFFYGWIIHQSMLSVLKNTNKIPCVNWTGLKVIGNLSYQTNQCRDPQSQIITDTQPSTETLCHNLVINNLPNNVQDPFSSYYWVSFVGDIMKPTRNLFQAATEGDLSSLICEALTFPSIYETLKSVTSV